MKAILVYFATKYKGDWDAIYHALDTKEKVSLEDLRSTEDQINSCSSKITTILDADYPRQLKEAYKPPFVIWTQGNYNLLAKETSQLIASGSEKELMQVCKELKNNNMVNVSNQPHTGGLAEALKQNNVLQIAIFNKGLDKDFKPNDKTLFMSELPPTFVGNDRTALNQQRLSAAIAKNLIILSSDRNMHSNTVQNFLNLGKEIYCFPSSSQSFNNSLIQNKVANLITSVNEIHKKEKSLERELG